MQSGLTSRCREAIQLASFFLQVEEKPVTKPRVQDQVGECYCSWVLCRTELEAADLANSKTCVRTTCLSLPLPEPGPSAVLPWDMGCFCLWKQPIALVEVYSGRLKIRSQTVLKTHSECNTKSFKRRLHIAIFLYLKWIYIWEELNWFQLLGQVLEG